MVGEQLGGNDGDQWIEPVGGPGLQRQAVGARHGIGRVGHDHDVGITLRSEASEQIHQLRVERAGRCDREDRQVRAHDRHRPVLEVSRRVSLGEHAGHLLELQRPLPRGRVVVAAAQNDEVALVRARGRRTGDRLFTGEGTGDARGQGRQRANVARRGAQQRR